MIVLRCIWPQCAFGHQIVINEKPVHHGFNRRFAWQQWKPKFCVAFTWTSVTSRPYKYGHAHIYGLYPGLSKNMAHAWSIVSFGFRPRISRLRGGGANTYCEPEPMSDTIETLFFRSLYHYHSKNISHVWSFIDTWSSSQFGQVHRMLKFTHGQVPNWVNFIIKSSSHLVNFTRPLKKGQQKILQFRSIIPATSTGQRKFLNSNLSILVCFVFACRAATASSIYQFLLGTVKFVFFLSGLLII